MADHAYAGQWWTRRVRLETGETILRSANAIRYGWLGGYAIGLLSITTVRLIWTPSLFNFVSIRWTLMKSELTSVAVHRRSRWLDLVGLWAIRIEGARKKASFTIAGGGWGAQRPAAEEWMQEIKQWANL
jgi:hypothetical protein